MSCTVELPAQVHPDVGWAVWSAYEKGGQPYGPLPRIVHRDGSVAHGEYRIRTAGAILTHEAVALVLDLMTSPSSFANAMGPEGVRKLLFSERHPVREFALRAAAYLPSGEAQYGRCQSPSAG